MLKGLEGSWQRIDHGGSLVLSGSSDTRVHRRPSPQLEQLAGDRRTRVDQGHLYTVMDANANA